jgi:hypothetical protein
LPIKIPKIPKIKILIAVAPKNVEYLARGPRVSTACDSISPEVVEIKPWAAISGNTNPLNVSFRKILKDRHAIPAARPNMKYSVYLLTFNPLTIV